MSGEQGANYYTLSLTRLDGMMEQSNGGVSLGNVKTHALILLFHAQVLQVVHFTSLFFEKENSIFMLN